MSSFFPWPFGSYALPKASEDDESQAPEPASQERTVSKLLKHYDDAGVPPPSSRVDPLLRQQERQPLRVRDVWKYGMFLASKATHVAGEVVSHHVWGPRRKSWGIEMTIITSFMRNASQHSQLMDIVTLRSLIGLAGFVPLPADALVTPVTFRVRKRKLRGLLTEWDSLETGARELSGEWVVGKKLWRTLQSEWKISQSQKSNSTRRSLQRRQKELVVLYLHGGAYYMFSASTHRLITIQLSKYIGARIFAVDYRLAPETRFPGQLQDAAYAYLRLIDDLHIPPENIIIAGDSAGGGLSLGLLMYLRDNQYPLPSGAILFSPWVDLTMSCDSWDSNAAYDIVPMPNPGDHLNPVACYLGQEGMEKYLTHPYASPLFGDFKGLPPMLVQAGDAEVLRDEITLLAHKATLAGVKVRHELYEDAVHVFQSFPFLDTARKGFLSCRDFVKNDLPRYQNHSPQSLDKVTEAGLVQEIDNKKARVVRGDGLEVGTGEDTRELDGNNDTTDDESKERDEDREYSSWVRHADSPPANSENGSATSSPGPIPSESSPDRPILRRIRSSLSLFAQQSPDSGQGHARSVSSQLSPSRAGGSRNHQRRATGGTLRLSTLSMSSSVANPPPPSIRSRNRTISHPDISSLCQQWATSGPANQTTKYGPLPFDNSR